MQIGIVYAFLRINEIYFIEYLPFAPISTIIGFYIDTFYCNSIIYDRIQAVEE
ncbi:hypothetical protein [Clostridioides difficile]|uniref:hypothetical protein n=1 Tax=Clostridioides difficile TaxID=1496 RepID=UPI001F438120|nr:hypothetical protein [Clostridioides difficile]